MPANRHIGFLLAGTAAVSLALATGAVQAQDSGARIGGSQSLASGRRASSRPARQPAEASPDQGRGGAGLLRGGLPPAGADADRPARQPVAAAQDPAARPGLHPPKTRRSRPPTQGLVRGDFRAAITPPGVASDVQPIQTGVPDPTAPAAVAARRRRTTAIDDPYAPLGLRVGNVVVTPVVGQYFGYDTNPNRLNKNQNASALSQTELELGLQSDWSRHDLFGQLRGAYSEYFDNPAARRPEGAGNLRLRLDVTRDVEIDIEGHYLIDTQRPSSPDLNANVVSRPIVYTEGASIGYTQRFNRLIAMIRGTIDRYDYGDAKLPGGLVIDQSDRAMTQYGLRGRFGYELNPGLIPFVEVTADTRQYDRKFDRSGFARSSDGIGVQGGTLFELTRLVKLEVSGGVSMRDYQDKRLGTLTSPIANATLSYEMTPLTTIRGTATATVDETAVAGSRGVRALRGTLEVQHALRRNLILTAGLRASDSAYQGVPIEEKGLGAFLRADYRMNRNLTLRASYAYDNIRSSSAGFSYNSNTFLLGLRLTP